MEHALARMHWIPEATWILCLQLSVMSCGLPVQFRRDIWRSAQRIGARRLTQSRAAICKAVQREKAARTANEVTFHAALKELLWCA